MAVRLRFLLDKLGSARLKTALAEHLGVTTMTLSRWARGDGGPRPEHLRGLARFTAANSTASAKHLVRWLQEDHEDPIEAALLEMASPTNAVRALRESYGLGMAEAAQLLGISRQSLHTWEHEVEDARTTRERIERCRAAWPSSRRGES